MLMTKQENWKQQLNNIRNKRGRDPGAEDASEKTGAELSLLIRSVSPTSERGLTLSTSWWSGPSWIAAEQEVGTRATALVAAPLTTRWRCPGPTGQHAAVYRAASINENIQKSRRASTETQQADPRSREPGQLSQMA